MQCNLTFSDLPDKYSTDRSKVIFALSFLRGTAMNWFLPGLDGLAVDEPHWFNDWPSFVTELTTNFGPHDIVGDAEASLNSIKMKDTQRITEYIVQFNSLAALVFWGDAALRHRFYTGLPARLKDDISRGDGKPNTLMGMRLKAQQCDARYWERRAEVTRDQGSDRPVKNNQDSRHSASTSNTANNTGNFAKSKKPHKTFPSKDKPHSNNATASSSRGGNSAKPATDLTGKLGTDGRLTSAEKQRRRENDLCLWCGEAGHMANVCPLNTKARAAKAETPTEPAKPASGQKKA
jgi:hypothetical protein